MPTLVVFGISPAPLSVHLPPNVLFSPNSILLGAWKRCHVLRYGKNTLAILLGDIDSNPGSHLGTRSTPISSLIAVRIHVPLTMQPLRNTLALLYVLLLICTPLHVFAAPWDAGTSDKINTQFATPQHHQHSVEPSRGFLRWLPQLTWLRNTGINNFLRRPLPPPIKNEKPTATPSTAKLPAKLLAHYGRDVVLRFNISTPDEERMLADAADHLMLDVWEFTSNWADIRLGEDAVR